MFEFMSQVWSEIVSGPNLGVKLTASAVTVVAALTAARIGWWGGKQAIRGGWKVTKFAGRKVGQMFASVVNDRRERQTDVAMLIAQMQQDIDRKLANQPPQQPWQTGQLSQRGIQYYTDTNTGFRPDHT